MEKLLDLQIFATGNNNNEPVRQYQSEFKELLKAVFTTQSYFGDLFVGGVEALDGVQNNEEAFRVKTSDIPVAVGTAYKEDADIGMGTGTGKSSRFGDRTEIKYVDTPVKYAWQWVFHEGIDRHTVNTDFDSAVADRLDLQAQAKVAQFNAHHSSFISTNATAIEGGASITKDNVAEVFNKLHKHFVNKGAIGTKVAKVTSDVYAAAIDTGLTTTSKGSSVNVDAQELRMFKGFILEEIPETMFQSNEVIYAYVTGIAKAFTGINTARTIESEDFDGVALQGAGKAGEYILPDNKPALVKVTVTGA